MVLVTYQPFILIGKILPFELGLYTSGIDGVLKGLVPYRDFFHLRGPLELYSPAFFMHILGRKFFILPYYFYIGTVVTFLGCFLIGRSLYRSRLIFYLAGLVVVARTFPRVAFNNWGGFRYAFGIFCLWCLVNYTKRGKSRWMFGAGFLAACGFLTSIEIGVCSVAGILAMFAVLFILRIQEARVLRKAFGAFCFGFFLLAGSYLVYLLSTNSLGPYVESQYSVVTNMTNTFNVKYMTAYPSGVFEVLWGLTPFSHYFKYTTPVYMYLFLFSYFLYRWKKDRVSWELPALAGIAVYGLIMYLSAWRNIESYQFEMALQPSKILMFYLIGQFYFKLLELKEGFSKGGNGIRKELTRSKIFFIYVLILGLVGSSVGFAVSRFNHRFVSFKIARNFLMGKDVKQCDPLNNVERKKPNIVGWEGVVLPKEQAEEFEQLVEFFDRNTRKNETVFMYPENSFYSYVIDRPFLGRFPMATFSWFNERWHEELLQDLVTQRPRYIVIPKILPPRFEKIYFMVESNRHKFEDVMRIIKNEYRITGTTSLSYIFEKK
jgi:hypothetical protein